MERFTGKMKCVFDYPDTGKGVRRTYDQDCEVDFDGRQITVTVYENSQAVVWKGDDKGHGHFKLIKGLSVSDFATLHRFEDGKLLEGRWYEAGDQGFWEIRLLTAKVVK